MGERKIVMNFVDNNIARQATFSRCLAGVLKEADALAKQCHVKTDVLVISPDGQPYVFQSPRNNSMVRNHRSRREMSLFTLKQARILKNQAKLNRIMQELKLEKEREKVLKKRLQESIGKRKKIEDMNLEELIAFKEDLEALRDKIMGKQMEGETSSSASIDTPKE